MPEQIENAMVVDSYWNEIEYGIPVGSRMRREREAFDEEERVEREERHGNII